MQRLRVKFGRGAELKFISHLDLMRCWERALRRAQVPLAYSEGFSPHPRISLGVPLALGVTSEAELMDVNLTRWVSPHWFSAGVGQQLPEGLSILAVFAVALTVPSLQSAVRLAEYRVEVESSLSSADVEAKIESFLSLAELPWRHQRDTGERKYDLRALVNEIRIDSWDERKALGMTLRCDSNGSGRPEQVAMALGLGEHPKSIHRTKLVLAVG